ncbi:MAG TPA: hypothetical protein VF549_07660 [Solirubrobacteraceae bacterium]|jgi:hypothetical protein
MSSKPQGGGLSVQTLLIASLSSLAAALFVHKFWQGGAIFGAAITPVIVALVSEALRKPADVITSRRTAVNPPPVVQDSRRDDPFGIWDEQKPRGTRRNLHVKLAVATGLIAFAIAAFSLTGVELVLGGGSSGDRFTVVPGKQKKHRSKEPTQTPASTEPDQANPVPDEDEPQTAPPAETTPPAETEPPAETTPPEDEQPAPTAPAAPPETLPTP